MDPITHAASGALAMLALPRRPSTPWAVPLAALAAAAPDIDVLAGWTPLLALQIHRGATHALAFAPLWALPLAWIMYVIWRRRAHGASASGLVSPTTHAPTKLYGSARISWSFVHIWLFTTAMILLHIWLDVVTTYGTLALLPFSDFRVRGNALFILDPWLTLPLLIALLLRRRKGIALAGILWVFLYPAAALGLHGWHTAQVQQRMPHAEFHILPDVLAPLNWRVLSRQHGVLRVQGMDWQGQLAAPDVSLPTAPPLLCDTLSAQDASCLAFCRFALLPVLQRDDDGAWRLYDLRFGSSLPWVKRLFQAVLHADAPFQLRVRMLPDGRLEHVRMHYSNKDSGWQEPRPPRLHGAGLAFGLY